VRLVTGLLCLQSSTLGKPFRLPLKTTVVYTKLNNC